MKIITLVRSEFARLTSSRMGVTALIALMTVPVVYGGLYLWGNADPYNRLNQVPAAIVVDDSGATVNGKTVNYGADAAAQLLTDGRFGWNRVSASAAAAGVDSGKYDFSITFPKSFSADLSSASATRPVKASLVLTTNDSNSYLSTTLAKQAAEAVRVAVARQVGDKATLILLDAVDSVRSGLVKASDGATQLADGAASATTGAASLASGTSALASGAATLSSGLSQLNGQASGLPANAAALAGGASGVAGGLSSASTASGSLSAAAAQAAALSPNVRAQLAAIFASSNVSPADQATILSQLDTLSGETATTSGIAAGLSGNLGALSAGATQVSTGAGAISSSAPSLAAAIAAAASGSANLASGAAAAASGATQLSGGVSQLDSGAAQLRNSLAAGVGQVPASTESGRAATAQAIADPLAVNQTAVTTAQNYGAGLAPFFISLAAWIGIYALFLLVRPLSRRALTAVRRPVRTALAGWLTPAILGAIQMVALFLVVTLALGLHPASPAGLLAFMILVSMTFAAIVLALNVWLGSVGQFLALVLMVVQLVVAGGTFPWQTLPAPLAALHQALPMSHGVEGARVLIYGGAASTLLAAVVQLVVWLLVALSLSALGALKQGRFRTLRELRPSPLAG